MASRGGFPWDEKGKCPVCGAVGSSCSPIMTAERGVQIVTLASQRERDAGMPRITVGERVYLDDSGRATVDPEKGARLWATPGMEVREEDAEAVGYKVQAPPQAKAVRRPKGGTKVVEGPGGDK